MLRTDPITGDLRIEAPGRAARLRPQPRGCPFCAGHEHITPAETGRRPRREHTPTAASWASRSFPNRFPLSDPHELVVPTPRHATSWRDLELPELQDGLSLLLERRRVLYSAHHDERYVHAFINDGAQAGASVSHVHAQLVLVERGPHSDRLTHSVEDSSSCALCHILTHDEELLVERGRHHAIVAHPVPRMAGALLVLPLTHNTDPGDDHGAEFAELLRRALAAAAPDAASNLWLVADPARSAHWYLELQPRTANLAGVELALGLSVSAATAAATAERARERLAMHR